MQPADSTMKEECALCQGMRKRVLVEAIRRRQCPRRLVEREEVVGLVVQVGPELLVSFDIRWACCDEGDGDGARHAEGKLNVEGGLYPRVRHVLGVRSIGNRYESKCGRGGEVWTISFQVRLEVYLVHVLPRVSRDEERIGRLRCRGRGNAI